MNRYFKCNKILKLCNQYNHPVTNHIFQLLQFKIDEENLIESNLLVNNQIHTAIIQGPTTKSVF